TARVHHRCQHKSEAELLLQAWRWHAEQALPAQALRIHSLHSSCSEAHIRQPASSGTNQEYPCIGLCPAKIHWARRAPQQVQGCSQPVESQSFHCQSPKATTTVVC